MSQLLTAFSCAFELFAHAALFAAYCWLSALFDAEIVIALNGNCCPRVAIATRMHCAGRFA